MLLETDQDESFWRIIEVIEPQVVNFKIINLQLKVLSLKMKFYRKHNQNAEYLQAAGLYYELSERNEVVTRNMLSSMITLRKIWKYAQSQNEGGTKESCITGAFRAGSVDAYGKQVPSE